MSALSDRYGAPLQPGQEAPLGVIPFVDGTTLLVTVVLPGEDIDFEGSECMVERVRDDVTGSPAGLEANVVGPAAFQHDIGSAEQID